MDAFLNISLEHFKGFLLIMARVGGLVATGPILSNRVVPVQVKGALVLLLLW